MCCSRAARESASICGDVRESASICGDARAVGRAAEVIDRAASEDSAVVVDVGISGGMMFGEGMCGAVAVVGGLGDSVVVVFDGWGAVGGLVEFDGWVDSAV